MQDVILEVDDVKVDDGTKLRNVVSSKRPNDRVKFKIIRDGEVKIISVKLDKRPKDLDGYSFQSNRIEFDIIGLKVKEENKKIIIADIDKQSNAFKKDIKPGDIILEVGKNKVNSMDEYNNAIKSYNSGDSIMLRIKNRDSTRFVAFTIN